MDLPTLINECSPHVGAVTMAAIVRTESSNNPWAIGDDTDGRSYMMRSKEDAVAQAIELLRQGHKIGIGLGQISSRNLARDRLNLTVEQAFDPCTNLIAAQRVLTWGYERAVKRFGPGQDALLAAVSAYNTGSLQAGFSNGYVAKVTNNAGMKIEINIPSFATGQIVRGRRGSVRVGAGGTLSPYDAPLDAFGPAPTAKSVAYTGPKNAPLEIEGF
ncbi:lytic transglycosylase [Pandoraea cepalis]|uniref:Lytic transglycosylase n=1 Tax=Pandoraea cepalis TaxID=2508294 RepID=A0AAW7MHC5_9BURK|nr:lytic transglycosylase domain-containing protein [Pandoraea cepalis]MDN4572040.1 lytic transglycosylase [Pandoraea cepalis]MDN4578886.1 lytic transglycosylase [Pandoraea cepalis]